MPVSLWFLPYSFAAISCIQSRTPSCHPANWIISPRLIDSPFSSERQTGSFRSCPPISRPVTAQRSRVWPARRRVCVRTPHSRLVFPICDSLKGPLFHPEASVAVYQSRSKSQSDLCPSCARSNRAGLISASFILAGSHNATNGGKYWPAGYLRSGRVAFRRPHYHLMTRLTRLAGNATVGR